MANPEWSNYDPNERTLVQIDEVQDLIQEAVDGYTPNESLEHYKARLRALYENLAKGKS
jgi:hypothetical protein